MSEITPEATTNVEQAPVERDYTAERDDRVVPIVSHILKTLGAYDIKFARGKADPATQKEERESLAEYIRSEVMPEAMKVGLQQSDIPHTFKLASTVIEMLRNRAYTPEDETSERISSCAKEIMLKLGEAETLRIRFQDDQADPVGSGEARANLYSEFFKTIVLPAFEKYEIKFNEVDHVYGIMATLITEVSRMTENTVKDAREVAEQLMWGVDDINSLNILTIHKKVIDSATEKGL